MEIITVPIEDIFPYENNPRINEASVEKVAASIMRFGFKQPIVVDKDNVVIVGHTRLQAAKRLGLDSVPVLVASDLSEDEAAAYRLADNKTAESSFWDMEKLDEELTNIIMDMSPFGFGDIEPIDFDLLFNDDDSMGQDEEPKEVKCPHCGLYFTL